MKYTIKNVLDKTCRGWVNARINGAVQNLCYNTAVELIERREGFEEVLVLEGPFKGMTARIPYKKKSRSYVLSYLEIGGKKLNSFTLRYNIEDRELSLLGLKVKTMHNKKIPAGKYFLLIPRYPHNKSKKYIDETNGGSRFAETWFQIESLNGALTDHFIHFGSISEGCITITDTGLVWTKVYLTLMNHRISDKYITELEIY